MTAPWQVIAPPTVIATFTFQRPAGRKNTPDDGFYNFSD